MICVLRNVLSIAILPGSAAVLVPWWLLRRTGGVPRAPDSQAAWAAVAVGVVSFIAGLILFSWSVSHFWTRGCGTLAPWDPPRQFVASGPYRIVRNPMISGVMFVLIGGGLLTRSLPIATWTTIFVMVNAIYIPLFEEPGLVRRFGDSYADYVKSVPRFLPRTGSFVAVSRQSVNGRSDASNVK